jgi:hypothetical protein
MLVSRLVAICSLVLVSGAAAPVGSSAAGSAQQWTQAGSMSVARYVHAAVRLPSGRVLVAGGDDDVLFHTAADVYDPASNAWGPIAPLPRPQRYHGASLSTGEALFVGGEPHDHAAGPSAYRFDEELGTWTATAIPPNPQSGHNSGRHAAQLVELLSGRLLYAGGYNNHGGFPAFTSAELYDPTTTLWSSTASMATGRLIFAAARLPSGKVIVTGGWAATDASAAVYATTEIYDPLAVTWTPGPPMSTPRSGHEAVALPSGKVLVIGGFPSGGGGVNALASAELYDPVTNSWAATAPMGAARAYHGATLLFDGRVLVVGGIRNRGDFSSVLSSAEVYSPATGTWSNAGVMAVPRTRMSVTSLPDGRALVAGGRTLGEVVLASAEIFAPPCTLTLPTIAAASSGNGMLEIELTISPVCAGVDVILVGVTEGFTPGTASASPPGPATNQWSIGTLDTIGKVRSITGATYTFTYQATDASGYVATFEATIAIP